MKDSKNDSHAQINSIAVIGNYLPRKCGIATFTTDLVESLSSQANWRCKAIAINDKPEGYNYPRQVRFEINQDMASDYRTAAEFLNINQADIISLQHEFGIFGGAEGDHILKLLRNVQMPIVTTLHTVLVEPTTDQERVMQQLTKLSDRFVVMSETAVHILHTIYDIPKEKIVYIPHGIPDMPFVDPNYYKDKFDLLGRKVLLTFGLLSQNKGIEYVIKGLPEIVDRFPDVIYIVLGATHPHVLESEGEKYRSKLERLVQQHGLKDHVIFKNQFVSFKELCDYLAATDLYITPYNQEDQITSGTLAYASGTGKAVISTPYWYAKEMLADGRGQLVPFRDEKAIAESVIDLFENETKRHQMRKRAYDFNRNATWEEVARQYTDVFNQVKSDHNHKPQPQASSSYTNGLFLNGTPLPPLKIDHLLTLSDDTGLLQHATHTIANRNHGYCTDDNARALIFVVRAQHIAQISKINAVQLGRLSSRYLAFLLHAYNNDTGRFHNFMTYAREWRDTIGSEDAHARALWALGITASSSKQKPHLSLTSTLFMRALETAESFQSPRALAFTLIGIDAYLKAFSGDSKARRIGTLLAERLLEKFKSNATDHWPWPEDILAYSNGKLPHALLLAGRFLQRDDMVEMGTQALHWLLTIQTENGHLTPIGNQNWYEQGGKKARFDQQPLETNALLEACITAFSISGDERWVRRAHICFSWFLGNNDLHLSLYNRKTGGCRDGLQSDRVNKNEGAESTLAWLLSLTAMYQLDDEEVVPASNKNKFPLKKSM